LARGGYHRPGSGRQETVLGHRADAAEPSSRWGWLCGLALVVAGLTALALAFVTLIELPDKLGFYGWLTRWEKAVDDHGKVVFVASLLSEVAGEREAVAVTTNQQSGVLRYYSMPRPLYLLPEAPTEQLDYDYLARHAPFLRRRGVRWLVWLRWDPAEGPMSWSRAIIYDLEKVRRGVPRAGMRVWQCVAEERPTTAGNHLVAALVVGLIAVVGCLLWPVAVRGGERLGLAALLPRGFALGLLTLHAVFCSLVLLGARFGRTLVFTVGGVALLSAVVARVVVGPRRDNSPRSAERGSLVRGLGLGVCVAMVGAAFALAMVMPVRNVDAIHHWGYTAKIFYYDGGVWNPHYLDPARGHVYRWYPVLVPLTLATMYEAIGWADDQAVKVLFPAFLAMLLLAVGSAMRRERRGEGWLIMVLALASCQSYFDYQGGAVSALADVPFSLFFLLGLLEWRQWAEVPGRSPLGWLLPSCGGAVTKTEGLVALGAMCCAAAFLRWRERPVPWRRLVLSVAVVLVLVVPWYGFVSQLPGKPGYVPGSGIPGLPPGGQIRRLVANLGVLIGELFNGPRWGALWVVVLLAVLLGWTRRSGVEKMAAGLVLLQFLAYLGAYAVMPEDPASLVRTTRMRLLLHLAPAAAWCGWCFLPPWRWLVGPPRGGAKT